MRALRFLQIGSFTLAVGALALMLVVDAGLIGWCIAASLAGWIAAITATIWRSKRMHAASERADGRADPLFEYTITTATMYDDVRDKS